MFVVEILKLGLSGVVFLLVLQNYRLLKQTLEKKGPLDRARSRQINLFMYMNAAFVLLVGASAVVGVLLSRRSDSLVRCRTSLEQLDTQAKLPDITVSNLRNGIAGHLSICRPVLEEAGK